MIYMSSLRFFPWSSAYRDLPIIKPAIFHLAIEVLSEHNFHDLRAFCSEIDIAELVREEDDARIVRVHQEICDVRPRGVRRWHCIYLSILYRPKRSEEGGVRPVFIAHKIHVPRIKEYDIWIPFHYLLRIHLKAIAADIRRAACLRLIRGLPDLSREKLISYVYRIHGIESGEIHISEGKAMAAIERDCPCVCPAFLIFGDISGPLIKVFLAGVDVGEYLLASFLLADNAGKYPERAIEALIDEAQALHDGAEQGLKPGNYPSTACTQLQNAINAAAEVLANEASTQADLLASVETLKAAMETFEAAVIPAHDLTELEALIAECEAFIAEYSSNSILDAALADAKAVVENPDDYTASEVDDVTETLEEALEYSEKLVGVAGIELSQLTVTSNGGVLRVAGLEGEATVNVYSMNGTLVGTAVTVENEYTFDLVPGTYVLTVVDNNCNGSRVVIVK